MKLTIDTGIFKYDVKIKATRDGKSELRTENLLCNLASHITKAEKWYRENGYTSGAEECDLIFDSIFKALDARGFYDDLRKEVYDCEQAVDQEV